MDSLYWAEVTMAELNIRSIKDYLLNDWLNHSNKDVRKLARKEVKRRASIGNVQENPNI